MVGLITTIAIRFGFRPQEAERFAKFVLVGTLGFVIDFGTLTLLVELVKLPEMVTRSTPYPFTVGLVLANSISFSLAVTSNFTLNRYWTYPESRSKRKRVQLPQFALVSVLGLLLNNLILALSVAPFERLLVLISAPSVIDGYVPAKMLATIVVLFWNFFVNRYWTYSNVV
ncbi:MAG: GtrA family protein [Candidatus Promineifilaceae bacterium]|nr:GtrA family protein [Candidatus Promineifilaceae bacterium]